MTECVGLWNRQMYWNSRRSGVEEPRALAACAAAEAARVFDVAFGED